MATSPIKPMLLDTHCHLLECDAPSNWLAIADIWVATTTPEQYLQATNAFEHSHAEIGLGLHPQCDTHTHNSQRDMLIDLAHNAHLWSEIGLDATRNTAHAKAQASTLSSLLALLDHMSPKILSLHARGTSDMLLTSLKPYASSTHSFIWHWFSGTHHELTQAISMGCWFSINYKMIASKTGKARIQNIPRNRLLLESDAPYANHCPSQLQALVPQLASIWKCTDAHALAQLHNNQDALVQSSQS